MVKSIEKYVQVDDFRMYSRVFQGKKLQPVIIMDAGYGDYSKAWEHIAEELTEFGTVLTYDRAGLGKSGVSSKRRISSEMIKRIKKLLREIATETALYFHRTFFWRYKCTFIYDFLSREYDGSSFS